jgi:hypothetical protein
MGGRLAVDDNVTVLIGAGLDKLLPNMPQPLQNLASPPIEGRCFARQVIRIGR